MDDNQAAYRICILKHYEEQQQLPGKVKEAAIQLLSDPDFLQEEREHLGAVVTGSEAAAWEVKAKTAETRFYEEIVPALALALHDTRYRNASMDPTAKTIPMTERMRSLKKAVGVGTFPTGFYDVKEHLQDDAVKGAYVNGLKPIE